MKIVIRPWPGAAPFAPYVIARDVPIHLAEPMARAALDVERKERPCYAAILDDAAALNDIESDLDCISAPVEKGD